MNMARAVRAPHGPRAHRWNLLAYTRGRQRYEPRRAIKRAKAAVHEVLATYATAADAEDYGDAEVFRKIEDVPEELRDETKHEGFRHEEESRIAVNADQQLARTVRRNWG